MLQRSILPDVYYFSHQALKSNLVKYHHSELTDITHRYHYCQLILKVCHKLGFPYYTSSTAMYLAHRFYATRNMKDHVMEDIAVACILVASKVEETVRKVKEILIATHSILTGIDLPYDHPDMDAYKKRIMVLERSILEACVFDFHRCHPHKYVIKFAKTLQGNLEKCIDWLVPQYVAARAWSFLDDSYYTTLSIQYPPHILCLACLYLSIQYYSLYIKDGLISTETLVLTDAVLAGFAAKKEHVIDAICQMCAIYLRQTDADDPITGFYRTIRNTVAPIDI